MQGSGPRQTWGGLRKDSPQVAAGLHQMLKEEWPGLMGGRAGYRGARKRLDLKWYDSLADG